MKPPIHVRVTTSGNIPHQLFGALNSPDTVQKIIKKLLGSTDLRQYNVGPANLFLHPTISAIPAEYSSFGKQSYGFEVKMGDVDQPDSDKLTAATYTLGKIYTEIIAGNLPDTAEFEIFILLKGKKNAEGKRIQYSYVETGKGKMPPPNTKLPNYNRGGKNTRTPADRC